MKRPDVISYARGLDLSAGEQHEIEAHLKDCAECRDFVVFIRKVNEGMRQASDAFDDAERLAESLVSQIASLYDGKFLHNPSNLKELNKLVKAHRRAYKERFNDINPIAFDLELNRWLERKRLTSDVQLLARVLGVASKVRPQRVIKSDTTRRIRPKPRD